MEFTDFRNKMNVLFSQMHQKIDHINLTKSLVLQFYESDHV